MKSKVIVRPHSHSQLLSFYAVITLLANCSPTVVSAVYN